MRAMQDLAVPEEALKANQVPTLARIDELDPLKGGADALRGRMANLNLVVIPGPDHRNVFARPESLSALQQFLAKHSQMKSGDEKAVPAGTPQGAVAHARRGRAPGAGRLPRGPS